MKEDDMVQILKESVARNSRLCLESLKKILPHHKRSQAEVITTVLLVLLGIVAVIIIISFVIPFIKNQISESDCLKVNGKVTITNNHKYTCYDTSVTPPKMRIQIHFGDDANLAGFAIEVGGATTKTYQVKKSGTTTTSTPNDVIMYSATASTPALELPGKNEERTYQIKNVDTQPEKIKVYPILSDGRLCDSFDELDAITTCPA